MEKARERYLIAVIGARTDENSERKGSNSGQIRK